MEQRHSEEVDLGETTPDTGELQLNKSDNHNPELNIEEIPPDVGHAWLVLVGASFAFATVFGSFNAFGLFQAYYLKVMFATTSAATISWIGTFCSSFTLMFGIFVGPLIGTIGLRRTTILGTSCCVLGLLLASFSKQVWQLTLTQGLIFGFGNSILINTATFTTSMWFKKRRRLALSIVAGAGGLGGLFYAPIASNCLKHIGLGWAFRVLALMTAVTTGIGCIVYKPRVQLNLPKKVIRLQTLKEPFAILLCLGAFFMEVGYVVPVYYFPVSIYAVSPKDISQETLAQNVIMVFCASSFIGRMTVGKISERIGLFTTLIASHLITATAVLSIWYVTKSYTVYYIFFVIYGFFCATYFVIIPIMIAEYYPISRVAELGGLHFLFVGLSVFVFSPVLGVVFDHFGHRTTFGEIIVICGLGYLVSGVIFFVMMQYVRRRGDVKSPIFI